MIQNTDPDGGDRIRLFLRVTVRCLNEEMEETTASDAERPVEELEPVLVRKFVAMRSQDLTGTEKVQPLQNAQEVYTLHAGRWRGATWHDRENNVVWLLAGRLHRSGAADDAYPYFKDLDADGAAPPDRG